MSIKEKVTALARSVRAGNISVAEVFKEYDKISKKLTIVEFRANLDDDFILANISMFIKYGDTLRGILDNTGYEVKDLEDVRHLIMRGASGSDIVAVIQDEMIWDEMLNDAEVFLRFVESMYDEYVDPQEILILIPDPIPASWANSMKNNPIAWEDLGIKPENYI